MFAEKISKDFIKLVNQKKYSSFEHITEIKFCGFRIREQKQIFSYIIEYERDYITFFMGNNYHLLENAWYSEFNKINKKLIHSSCVLARNEIQDILESTYNIHVKDLRVGLDGFYYDNTGGLLNLNIGLEF